MTADKICYALHYFRTPRSQWELLLARARQLGVEVIFSPVPWLAHEVSDGRFDLNGQTNLRRDLIGFVALCQSMGFAVRLDVSPIIPVDASLLHNGLPGWQVEHAADLLLQDSASQIDLRRWYQTLTDALGVGEPSPDVSMQLSLPAEPLPFSEEIRRVAWPLWLRKRYANGGLDALNKAYLPAQPFRSFNDVNPAAPATSPALTLDLVDFREELRANAEARFEVMLTEFGWPPAVAIDAPPHVVQIQPDPADVGRTLRWADHAPIRGDGMPRDAFWAQRKPNLDRLLAATPETELVYIPVTAETAYSGSGKGAVYRLLLNGDIAGQNADEAPYGSTDLYFSLKNPNAPLTGFLKTYLASLMTAQQQVLHRCTESVQQWLAALEPPSPAAESTPPTSPMTAAEKSLADANAAFFKAAASIGALEEAFAIALDKMPSAENALAATPDFGLSDEDSAQVKQSLQQASILLKQAAGIVLPDGFSLTEYEAAFAAMIGALMEVLELLEGLIFWLRENLSASKLPSSTWLLHNQIQFTLQHIFAGVLRQ